MVSSENHGCSVLICYRKLAPQRLSKSTALAAKSNPNHTIGVGNVITMGVLAEILAEAFTLPRLIEVVASVSLRMQFAIQEMVLALSCVRRSRRRLKGAFVLVLGKRQHHARWAKWRRNV